MSKKITIGTNALTYPEIRNFAGLNLPNIQFKKVIDIFKIPSFFLFKLFRKINRKFQNSFYDLGLNKVDFFHFFNVINLGKQPYFTTYETTLPRWHDNEKDFKKGLRILAKPQCKQIIALSKCAFEMQKTCIQKYAPKYLESIMIKNCIMLPPQRPFINNYSEKNLDTHFITFTIVGADFFRKGGLAILNTFDELLQANKPVKLNIVSTLNYGDYASKTTIEDQKNAHLLIEKHSTHISHFQSLNNKEVENLLKHTHIALLPSLAETFGYFILEAQAAACPVISTDIRAMPEINNEEKGWVIQIKKEGSYEADISNPNKLSNTISQQLKAIIEDIIDNRPLIEIKGNLSLNGILENHSIEKHSKKLLALYKLVEI